MTPSPARAPQRQDPVTDPAIDLVVAAGRERVVLIAGAAAGICLFFAPLLVLGLGLLAAYLADVVSDGAMPVVAIGRPLTAQDFRAVFAPAVNEAPLLVTAAVLGALLAELRRRLAKGTDPAFLAAGIRRFFPEYAALYLMLVITIILVAATHGGTPQVMRLAGAAPVFLPFMLCVAWIAHAIWNYCFRSVVDLLASQDDRTAATELRARARLLRSARRT